MSPSRAERLAGTLLGTAVGDALGLPREGLSAARAQRLFGDELEHRFLLGGGMLSDDTEHTCIVAQAFLAARGDIDRFARSLAWRLRGWMLGLPAGVGLGTARAIFKLWLGWPPNRSGVWTAGNGPAMRVGILGLLVPGDDDELRRWVSAATRITHTDPRAERAAFLVALGVRHGPEGFVERARTAVPDADDELLAWLELIEEHAARGDGVGAFASALGVDGRGVSGYAYRTVPVALYAFLRHADDFRTAITRVCALGGDADTVAAITGALAGSHVGAAGIPAPWVDGIRDRPRSVAWMRRLAARLASSDAHAAGALPLAWPWLPLRNALFLVVVLLHGLRRLLPPYA